MPHASPHWSELVAGWELGIYREPIYCGLLAGLLLGYLGVFVVLRRSVFVTATVSQAAGLGVALAFYLQIHAALEVPPVLGAILVALGFTAARVTLIPRPHAPAFGAFTSVHHSRLAVAEPPSWSRRRGAVCATRLSGLRPSGIFPHPHPHPTCKVESERRREWVRERGEPPNSTPNATQP